MISHQNLACITYKNFIMENEKEDKLSKNMFTHMDMLNDILWFQENILLNEKDVAIYHSIPTEYISIIKK